MAKRLLLVFGLVCLGVCGSPAQVLLFGVTGVNGTPSSLYTVNTTTAAATLVGPTGYNGISSLAFGPDGTTLYAIANASGHVLIRINTTTGAGTTVGPTGLTVNVPDIAVRSDGAIFGINGNGDFIQFNPATGAGTVVGNLGLGFPGGGAIAFNASGTLYLSVVLGGGAGTNLYTVNTATGAPTQVGTFNFSGLPAGTDRFAGMKFQPGTGTLFLTAFVNIDPANTVRLASTNTFSGTITPASIGDPGVVFEAIAFGSRAAGGTPTPTVPISWNTLLAIALGMASIAMYELRQKRISQGK